MVSSPPPSFLVVSECDSSFHWIHLDIADEPHAGGADREIGVLRRRVRRHGAADMDELAFIGRVDRVGADRNDGARAFGQRPRRRHRAALVPEQQDDHADDQQQPDDHPADRSAQPAEPRYRCGFSERIAHLQQTPKKGRELRPLRLSNPASTLGGYRSFLAKTQLLRTRLSRATVPAFAGYRTTPSRSGEDVTQRTARGE